MIKKIFTLRVILTAFVVWIGLCALTTGSVLLVQPAQLKGSVPTAVVTVVYAPTSTVTPSSLVNLGTASPNQTPVVSDIHTGSMVQISGTSGEGLRFRSAPGIASSQLFIAKESENFEVKDGPVSSGDYTWWFLVSKTDPQRNGWAAANFLSVVN